MPYVVKRRGKGWGCWNEGSNRWMAKKPQSFQAASAQASAARAGEHGWEGTGKKARRYVLRRKKGKQ